MSWGYRSCSSCPPGKWQNNFDAGKGSSQSPIDIKSASTENKELRPLKVTYNSTSAKNIINNGHSVQVNFDPGCTISGAHLSNEYELIQFHFHWGSKPGQGAEHTINGKSADAELHFVHKNPKYENPLEHSDGLAVLGVQLIENDEKAEGKMKVTEFFSRLDKIGHELELNDSLDLNEMLPSSLDSFFTYQGSLTTPPLSECVCWTVLEEPFYLTTKEMNAFRSLDSKEGGKIVDNFRPVQPINNREVNHFKK